MEAKTTDETKITSVIKEKIKDPIRVAQGKKLGAISREAKERKAKERTMQEQSEEEEEEDRRRREEEDRRQRENSSNMLYVIIPIIGIALGGYFFLYLCTEKIEKKNLKRPKKTKNQI